MRRNKRHLKIAIMKKIGILFVLSFLYLLSCSDRSKRVKFINETQVFVSEISWDTTRMETFGSGEILFFNPNHEVKIFCNAFLKNRDSLSWGEPGIILKIGKWHIENDKVICEIRTIYRTFKVNNTLTTDIDTFYFENELLKNKTMHYSTNPLMTKELTSFMRMDWGKFWEH